jgi:hypothetical protein
MKTARKLNRTPPDVIKANIIECIEKHGPSRILAIADEYGFTRSTTRKFARALCDENKVHSIPVKRTDGGSEYFFHLGPAPDVQIDDSVDHSMPHRPVRTAWKPNHIRDVMVCALFGVPAAMVGAQV